MVLPVGPVTRIVGPGVVGGLDVGMGVGSLVASDSDAVLDHIMSELCPQPVPLAHSISSSALLQRRAPEALQMF